MHSYIYLVSIYRSVAMSYCQVFLWYSFSAIALSNQWRDQEFPGRVAKSFEIYKLMKLCLSY